MTTATKEKLVVLIKILMDNIKSLETRVSALEDAYTNPDNTLDAGVAELMKELTAQASAEMQEDVPAELVFTTEGPKDINRDDYLRAEDISWLYEYFDPKVSFLNGVGKALAAISRKEGIPYLTFNSNKYHYHRSVIGKFKSKLDSDPNYCPHGRIVNPFI